jgi:hypothetical protein
MKRGIAGEEEEGMGKGVGRGGEEEELR